MKTIKTKIHRTAYNRKREDILKAAEKRFSRHGIKKTTIEEVARDLRIGKTSLYNYFNSKEHLFQETVKWLCADFLETIKTNFNNEELSPEERLKVYFELKKDFFAKYKMLSQMLINILNEVSTENENELMAGFWQSESEVLRLAIPICLNINDEASLRNLSWAYSVYGSMISFNEKLFQIIPEKNLDNKSEVLGVLNEKMFSVITKK